jgi:urease accessory protein
MNSLVSTNNKVIAVHDGVFHADEALACSILLHTDEFNNAVIVRTRDENTIRSAHIAVDVGGEYDPNRHRYDHHQRNFNETFSEKDDVKLSSAGLIYKHFGREVVYKCCATYYDMRFIEKECLEEIFTMMYSRFIKPIDGVDNGIPMYDTKEKPRYNDTTTLSSRVNRLNPSWNETLNDREIFQRFQKAMHMTWTEFDEALKYYFVSYLPSQQIVDQAFEQAKQHDQHGRIVLLRCYAPWKQRLRTLEEKYNRKVLYVVYPSKENEWVSYCVPESGFISRKPFPQQWQGLVGEELDKVTGVPGGVFVHHNGFICGHHNKEGVLEMTKIAMCL